MTEPNLNLLQGTLDVLVLKALEDGALHGYGVAQWIREVTEQELQIEEGALYTALHRMERRKWLVAEWGLSETRRKAKFYRLTARGRLRLAEEIDSWTKLTEGVALVLKPS
jgi:transcriptional regulator